MLLFAVVVVVVVDVVSVFVVRACQDAGRAFPAPDRGPGVPDPGRGDPGCGGSLMSRDVKSEILTRSDVTLQKAK